MKTKRAQPCSPLEEIDGNNTKRRAIEGIASVEASHAMSAMMKSLATNDVSMINDATKTSLDSNETSVQLKDDDYSKENSVESDEVVEVKVELQEQDDEKTNKIKSTRERWSWVWVFFDILPIGEDGRERAKCKACGKIYISDTKGGTGTLGKHAKKCPRRNTRDIGQQLLSKSHGSMLTRSSKFVAEKFRELVSMAIIKHDLPFQFVEYDGIRAIFRYLNEDVITISRNTAKSDVLKMHKREKIKLKQMLEVAPGRVSLTADCWTSINTDGYLCVTSHFIDNDWKLQKRVISFQFMPPPHTGVFLAEKMSNILSEWGIEKKLFALTLDNAYNNDTFVGFLKSQLNSENALVSDGNYLHVRCCAHVLNLIVQDGLKAIDDAVKNVRESVKYVKGSQARKQKFIDCVKLVNLNPKKGLRQDVPTRWNATYLMIESAIFYRRAFFRLAVSDNNFKHCPSDEQWVRVEKIFRFLEVFFEVTSIFSGNKYPTANLYFHSVYIVELTLKQEMESSDSFMQKMACQMYEKFEKYWSDYSVILAMAAVLDPRYKMQYVEFAYMKLNDGIPSYKSSIVREKITALFDEYMCNGLEPSSTSHSSKNNGSKVVCGENCETVLSTNSKNMFKEFNTHESQESANERKTQLEMYLKEPRSAIEEKLDVLSFWKAHQYRYPQLACMARDILSIPVSTVASESAFSNGGRVLDQYRSALKPETVEALVCTRDWLFGIEGDEELSLHDLTEDIMQLSELKVQEGYTTK